jgi:3' terminal RNA ribose 2'-O-methyltransferase Hen1
LIRSLFEPLGYNVELTRHTLDEKFPDWGESKYFSVRLSNTITIKDLLSHLYVLIPTLDNDKHYFVSESEIEKLIKKGEGWLKDHPERDQIVRRYLINLNSLARKAFERLSEGEATAEADDETIEDAEVRIRKESLNQRRIDTVVEKIVELGADSVIDLGCGEGKLVKELLKHKQFSRIAGMDVSYDRLLRAKDRLHFEHMAPRQKERIQLFQGSLTYRDKRLEGYDAAAVVEVIEHLELDRLRAFESVVFEFARPGAVIVTTPNKEYNVMWEKLGAEKMRHDDHRFEWTRSEFAEWANGVCKRFGYRAEILPIGDEDAEVGAPTQMAVFKYGN